MTQYISPIASNVVVIGDDNAHTVLNPPPGFSKGHEDRDYAADPVGANFATPPDDFLIDPSLWDDMIEEGDRNESSLMHMWLKAPGSKPPNQNGTNYCWAFAAIDAVKAFLIRTGAGYIDLSPASVACKVKNFANQGGWDLQAVKYAAQHGVCECKYWPEYSRDRKYDNAESQENRKKYIIDKWWDVPDDDRFAYKVSAMLRRYPMPSGYSWWGHETLGMWVAKVSNTGSLKQRYSFIDLNSWGAYGPKNDGFFYLSGSKGTPGNCSIPYQFSPV
jgi:hypothetical protein